MPAKIISAEITPKPRQATMAARALQERGFRILHIGLTISVQANRSVWKSTFGVSFTSHTKSSHAESGAKAAYFKPQMETLQIPETLSNFVAEVNFVEPPEFFGI